MELKVKDLITALSKVDENEVVYIEASFGGSDKISEVENAKIKN